MHSFSIKNARQRKSFCSESVCTAAKIFAYARTVNVVVKEYIVTVVVTQVFPIFEKHFYMNKNARITLVFF